MIGRRACACFTPFIPYTRRKTLILRVFRFLWPPSEAMSGLSWIDRTRTQTQTKKGDTINRVPFLRISSLRQASSVSQLACFTYLNYIIPPGGIPIGGCGFSSGSSATTHSVVRIFLAIDAAFCSAERVTRAGSMMPTLTRSS